MFQLVNVIFYLITISLDNIIGVLIEGQMFGWITLAYGIVVIIPNITVTVRRLHDIGMSGWWILINFVPFVGFIGLLILALFDSQPHHNEYGANPKQIPFLEEDDD